MRTMATENQMKIQIKKFNFEHAIRPVYYFSRLTGQWPFSIIHNANGKIQRARVGFFEILWSILVICLNLTVSLDSYEDFKAEQEKHPIRIRFIVGDVLDMSSVLFITIGIVLGIINRKRLVNVLKKINAFDSKVRWCSNNSLSNSNEIRISNFAL